MADKIEVDGKTVTLTHVSAGYSSPKATKWLDTALRAEERDSGNTMIDKALTKAVECEAQGI